MLIHYLQIAWRNIMRKRIIAGINILGLALSLCAFILIYIFVSSEVSYDRFHANAHRIFRVNSQLTTSGKADALGLSSFSLQPRLSADFPEVEQAARVFPISKQTFWRDQEVFTVEDMCFADSNLFKIFTYEFLEGNPDQALTEPNSIILSDETARLVFGKDQGVLGQHLRFTKNTYKVTGVYKDNGHRSHLRLNAMLSLSSMSPQLRQMVSNDWFYMAQTNYVLLRDPGQQASVEARLAKFVKDEIEPWLKTVQTTSTVSYSLQPLTDIHLDITRHAGYARTTNPSYLKIFSMVAVLLVLIACINYMNLATAHSMRRSKEVGIRKTAGATRGQLITQFLMESVGTALVATVLALALAELLLPAFNHLTDRNFSLGKIISPQFLAVLAGVGILTGLLAGSYPAVLLSGFRPAQVLRAGASPRSSATLVRKGLVVLQFAAGIFMIACTLVVFKQMHFLRNKDLGFDKENLLVIKVPVPDSSFVSKLQEVKNRLLQHPQVLAVGGTNHIPGQMEGQLLNYVQTGEKAEEHLMNIMMVDADFLRMMKLPLKQGRYFNDTLRTDSREAFIVNESALRTYNWAQLDKVNIKNGLGYDGRIVGVLKDFHFSSLHVPVQPLLMMKAERVTGFLVAKLQGPNLQAPMHHIETVFKQYSRRYPYESFLLEQQIAKLYRGEEKMLTIFSFFSLLTIAIACMGLYGLSAYTTAQRTKEIGIRKILGAGRPGIVLLLSRDFALLVAVAMIAAVPAAWYYSSDWLSRFAYRTSVSWWLFVVACLLAVIIAMATVWSRAWRAAGMDPARALRYE